MTPRENFQTSGHAKPFAALVASEHFEPACEYALLEMVSEIHDPMNPTGLAQIIGARRVLEILKTLSEPIKPPERMPKQTLHY
jgi:hypothetical protein